MKRAGIYFFFDKDGIVDRYVPYFIQELHKVVDYIVVVVNGKLTPEGRMTLTKASDDMFVRDNKGFDVWAYKDAIEYISWDKLKTFDELVITNFTVYGPVYPFAESFQKMEKEPCDFWGATQGYGNAEQKNWFGIPLPNGRPDYIASNFIVFKDAVLHSFEFKQFIEGIPEVKSYFESGAYFEFPLTKKLQDAGFRWMTLDNGMFRTMYQNPSVNGALHAVAQLRVPIMRRKAFYDSNGFLDFCTDIPRQLIKYIDEHTNYDSNLVWENILRTTNLYDLKNWFNWNQILPKDRSKFLPERYRIAAIFHTYYDDIMGRYLHNIASFPPGTDFYFTTDTEEKAMSLKSLLAPFEDRFHIEYRLVENRGRDVSALLVGCRDVVIDGGYDLICFMHDKKGIGNKVEFSCVGESFSDCCFENTAASEEYISNVIELFDQQPRLGLAVPPPPKNSNYYKTIGGSWGANPTFTNVQKLLNELSLSVPLDFKKPPVSAYGSVFWFRPEALMPLFRKRWKYSDFDAEPMAGDGTISNAVERVHGFIAQSQGYYTSIIMNSVYAEQEVTRMTDIAHTYVEITLRSVGPRLALQLATTQLCQMLQQKKTIPPKPQPKPQQKPGTTEKVPEVTPEVPRGIFKAVVRDICPIGLWNNLRRIKCIVTGGVYVEPAIERGLVKSAVRACTPRFIWNELRKIKCKKNGWVYVED